MYIVNDQELSATPGRVELFYEFQWRYFLGICIGNDSHISEKLYETSFKDEAVAGLDPQHEDTRMEIMDSIRTFFGYFGLTTYRLFSARSISFKSEQILKRID